MNVNHYQGSKRRAPFVLLAFSALLALGLFGGCGSKDQPNPAPAPAPTTPVTPPTTPPPYNGSNCGLPSGGQAINGSSPFYAYLDNGSGSVTNTISLTLAFLNPGNTQNPYSNYPQNIVGSASLVLGDIGMYSGYPNSNGAPASVCVSSNGNIPGIFVGDSYSQSASIQLMLQGSISLSSQSNWYYTPPQQTHAVQVLIGYDCPAYLIPGSRIQGCVRVTIGSPPMYPPVIYQAQ